MTRAPELGEDVLDLPAEDVDRLCPGCFLPVDGDECATCALIEELDREPCDYCGAQDDAPCLPGCPGVDR